MSIRVTCQSCGRSGRVPETALGKVLKCPACGHRNRLTAEASDAGGLEILEGPAGAEGLELLEGPSNDEGLELREETPGPSRSSSPPMRWGPPPATSSPERVVARPSRSPALAPLFLGLGALGAVAVVSILAVVIAAQFRGGKTETKEPSPLAQAGAVPVAAPPQRAAEPDYVAVARASATASRPDDGAARPLNTAEIVEQSEPSIALIRGKASSGTGFLVGPGLLATNAHVVDGEFIQNLEIRFPSADDAHKGPIPAELLYEDAKRDLAFLAVKTTLPPLRVAQAYHYRKGEDVTVIGNPGIGDGGTVLENAISRGVMSSKAEIEGQKFYQLGIAVNPGNSGGPVFDSTGRVIGVVTLRIPDKQELSFCIPVEELRAGLAKLGSQTAQAAAETQSRHRLINAFKNLSTAGAIYGLDLELHLVLQSNPQDKDLNERVKTIDSTVPDLEKSLFWNLGAESNVLRNDALVVVPTRNKMGELTDNYLKLKTAFEKSRSSTPLNVLRALKSTHRRLIDALKTDLKVEVPAGLLAALEDHIVVGPTLAMGPSDADDPANRILRHALERRGMMPPRTQRIMPPTIPRGPRFSPRGRFGP